jgi:hypothetical protein
MERRSRLWSCSVDVERALLEHSTVRDAAGFTVPDPGLAAAFGDPVETCGITGRPAHAMGRSRLFVKLGIGGLPRSRGRQPSPGRARGWPVA